MFEPTSELTVLQKRAQLLRQLRAFFYAREVMEVDVPSLGRATVTDVNLEPLQVDGTKQIWYLQTSPEYYMKRMLAAGSGDIFYLGKAFRQDERGRRHRPEFTMLEWYRCAYDDAQLRRELRDLFSALAPEQTLRELSYGELFESAVGVCPHRSDTQQLKHAAKQHIEFYGELPGKSAWLDLLFSHCVESELQELTIVYDYPQEQCALARVQADEHGMMVAKRFEVFWRGIELANGYWELTSAAQQRQRLLEDQQQRWRQGLPVPAIDARFMAALEHGLPDCAGVALGVDRLLMCLLQQDDIAAVMPFADG